MQATSLRGTIHHINRSPLFNGSRRPGSFDEPPGQPPARDGQLRLGGRLFIWGVNGILSVFR